MVFAYLFVPVTDTALRLRVLLDKCLGVLVQLNRGIDFPEIVRYPRKHWLVPADIWKLYNLLLIVNDVQRASQTADYPCGTVINGFNVSDVETFGVEEVVGAGKCPTFFVQETVGADRIIQDCKQEGATKHHVEFECLRIIRSTYDSRNIHKGEATNSEKKHPPIRMIFDPFHTIVVLRY